MKQMKLVVLSLAALALGRPSGFCTANADDRPLDDYTIDELKTVAAQYKVEITSAMKKADIVSAIKHAPGYVPAEQKPEDRMAALERQLVSQKAEIERLKAASPVALPLATTEPTGTLDLLLKGAGVEMKDVGWRIRAGLSHEQAVEVALNEKREREAAKKEAKK